MVCVCFMASPAVPPTVQIGKSVEKHHTPLTYISSAVRVDLDFVPEQSLNIAVPHFQA